MNASVLISIVPTVWLWEGKLKENTKIQRNLPLFTKKQDSYIGKNIIIILLTKPNE